MHTTSPTLLARLKQPADERAWQRFNELYTPLLYYWLRRAGLGQQEAADVVQEVMIVLVRTLPEFEYDKAQSFRSWLRTVLMNKYRDRGRKQMHEPAQADTGMLDEAAATEADSLFTDEEYRQQVVARALQVMQRDFEEKSWRAVWAVTVDGVPAAEAAAQFELTLGGLYAAKFRILQRLKEELAGLLDG
jgi:RNA polymerase sigma-70 factor (ECF subfamily)